MGKNNIADSRKQSVLFRIMFVMSFGNIVYATGNPIISHNVIAYFRINYDKICFIILFFVLISGSHCKSLLAYLLCSATMPSYTPVLLF